MIIITGQGNLASALVAYFRKNDVQHIHWALGDSPPAYGMIRDGSAVCIHVGSEGRWPSLTNLCNVRNIPLILGSTGQDHLIPEILQFPIIKVPNFALEIVAFLYALPALARTLQAVGMTVSSITESHQISKKSVPGTAKEMARICGLPEDKIVSVRDPGVQVELGVPFEFLYGHGYHWINFGTEDTKITLRTKVNGREPYAKGALHIAQSILQRSEPLLPGVYSDMSSICSLPEIKIS